MPQSLVFMEILLAADVSPNVHGHDLQESGKQTGKCILCAHTFVVKYIQAVKF